jgi:hypothetical protein
MSVLSCALKSDVADDEMNEIDATAGVESKQRRESLSLL